MVNVRLQRSGPWARALLYGTAGAVLGMMALVWTRNEITRLRYRLADVAEQRALLHAEIEKLEIELAALGSPRRIEARALALGLRYPQPGQVIHLDERAAAEAQVAAAPRAVVTR